MLFIKGKERTMDFKISNIKIGDNHPCFALAQICSNTNPTIVMEPSELKAMIKPYQKKNIIAKVLKVDIKAEQWISWDVV